MSSDPLKQALEAVLREYTRDATKSPSPAPQLVERLSQVDEGEAEKWLMAILWGRSGVVETNLEAKFRSKFLEQYSQDERPTLSRLLPTEVLQRAGKTTVRTLNPAAQSFFERLCNPGADPIPMLDPYLQSLQQEAEAFTEAFLGPSPGSSSSSPLFPEMTRQMFLSMMGMGPDVDSNGSGSEDEAPARKIVVDVTQGMEFVRRSLANPETLSPQALCEAVESVMDSVRVSITEAKASPASVRPVLSALLKTLEATDTLSTKGVLVPFLTSAPPPSFPSEPSALQLQGLAERFLSLALETVSFLGPRVGKLPSPAKIQLKPDESGFLTRLVPSALVLLELARLRGAPDDILFFFLDLVTTRPPHMRVTRHSWAPASFQIRVGLEVLKRSLSILERSASSDPSLLRHAKLVLSILTGFQTDSVTNTWESDLKSAFPPGSSFAPGFFRALDVLCDPLDPKKPSPEIIGTLSFFLSESMALDVLLNSRAFFRGIDRASVKPETPGKLFSKREIDYSGDSLWTLFALVVQLVPGFDFLSSTLADPASPTVKRMFSLIHKVYDPVDFEAHAAAELLVLLLRSPVFRARFIESKDPKVQRLLKDTREKIVAGGTVWTSPSGFLIYSLHLDLDVSRVNDDNEPKNFPHLYLFAAVSQFLPPVLKLGEDFQKRPSVPPRFSLSELLNTPLSSPFSNYHLPGTIASLSQAVQALSRMPPHFQWLKASSYSLMGDYSLVVLSLEAFYKYLEDLEGNGWVFSKADDRQKLLDKLNLPPLELLVDLCFETGRALRALELQISWERLSTGEAAMAMSAEETWSREVKSLEEKSRKAKTASERLKAKSELKTLQAQRPQGSSLRKTGDPKWAKIPVVRRAAARLGKRLGALLLKGKRAVCE